MIAARPAYAGEPAASPATDWHIITGEYPPQPGGVSDYTRLVAHALADAGDRVTVWAPPCGEAGQSHPGVIVHRLPDRFGLRSLAQIGRALDRAPEPARLLVQYVPHAFGWKAMNIPFCLWLRSRRRQPIWVMFHEVAFPSGRGHTLAHNALSVVTRWMAGVVGRAAERMFVSVPAWRPMIAPFARPGIDIDWLPVPSTVRAVNDVAGAALLRSQLGGGRPLVGHIGTYGPLLRPLLDASVPALLAATDCHVLLLGHGGDAYRADLVSRHPSLGQRIHAPGSLPEADLSRHVSACDVMLQPYPDGVSSRRTSTQIALSHGRPVVTTVGHLSDPMWTDCGAVVLAPDLDPAGLAEATATLLADPARQRLLSARGRALNAETFDLSRTIATLRTPAGPGVE